MIAGALRSIGNEQKHRAILDEIGKAISQGDLARLLLLAPFCRSTWQMVDTLDEAHRNAYWENVIPNCIHDADDENNEAVERLLAAQRPCEGFSCIRYKPEAVEPSVLFRLLSDIVKGRADRPGHYQLEQYDIERAFVQLNKIMDLTLEQKAGLEFSYIDALARPWSDRAGYGIPNLEKYVELHPELFVQAIVWNYERRDGTEEPPEFKVAPENVQHLAERGYKLLEAIERIPGHDDLGELQTDRLAKWVKTVRDACKGLGRAEIADICLGKLFSSAPEGRDSVWPCESVRQVMEDIQSEDISRGARPGLYNARGVRWRGEGGDQERELAEKYRKWAQALQYSHPFVASTLLMGMVKTYEYEASREDTEAGIRRRLR